MIDRRKYVRVDSCVGVHYTFADEDSLPNTAVSKDISSGGIRIILKHRIDPGRKLNLELSLPGEQKPVAIIGEVIWQQEQNASGDWKMETGIKYVKINSWDMQRLTIYLLSCLKNKIDQAKEIMSDRLVRNMSVADLFTREIRLPGDKSKTVSVPDFLVQEISLPGDKIRYGKLPVSVEIKYKSSDGIDRVGRALNQYIGRESIWLLLEEDVMPATLMEIKIQLPDALTIIIANGEVIASRRETRCSSDQVKTYHGIKVRFINIDATDVKSIIRFIYAYSTAYVMLDSRCSPEWM